MVGPGQGPGLSDIRLGERGGTESVTLSANNLPPQQVNINLGGAVGNQSIGTDNYLAFNALGETIFTDTPPNGATLNVGTAGTSGAGQSISNQSPYLGVTMIIATFGTYPSRN